MRSRHPIGIGDSLSAIRHLVPVRYRHRAREAQRHLNRHLSEIDRLLGRPTVFHVTHWKAGSQWVRALLESVAPRRIVPPRPKMEHLREEPILPGRIYPTTYMTLERLEALQLPQPHRIFVVIRDLRDTAVSYYFSMRYSHPLATGYVRSLRDQLEGLDEEQGLLEVLNGPMRACARIQLSWLNAGVPVFRYEDLLANTEGTLAQILDHCEISVSRRRLRRAVKGNAFQRKSGGRKTGQEDVRSHFRKGVAGDWRNHFSPRLTHECKTLFGDALVQTGYEDSLDW